MNSLFERAKRAIFAFEQAIDAFDGQIKMAKELNVTQGFISQIKTGIRKCPRAFFSPIEKKTKNEITREELRPDFFDR